MNRSVKRLIKNNGRKPLSVDKGRKPNVSIDNRQNNKSGTKKILQTF